MPFYANLPNLKNHSFNVLNHYKMKNFIITGLFCFLCVMPMIVYLTITTSNRVERRNVLAQKAFFVGQKCDLTNYQISDSDEFTLICEHVTDTNELQIVVSAKDSTFIEFLPN